MATIAGRSSKFVVSPSGGKRGDAGFTLLELTVAFFIFVTVLIASLAVVNNGMTAAAALKEHSSAARYLRGQIELLRVSGVTEDASMEALRTIPEELRSAKANVEITDYSLQTPGLKRVAVTIEWDGVMGHKTQTMTTLLRAGQGT